ncbi:MAG: hypothetical protein KDC38_10350, partial [Planctomycetes bacterium]|nr:hypothetical protein [Planctomycetota bacterium]
NISAGTDGPSVDACLLDDLNGDVWFLFTSPFTGQVAIESAPGTLGDTVMVVYDPTVVGCPPVAGDPSIACDDDDGTGLGSLVQIGVVAGNDYLIQVGDFGGAPGQTGTFDLVITQLEDCTDGLDNDMDGLVDCDDPDCTNDPACPEICDDGVDNDADGAIDCADSECVADPICIEEGEIECGDGLDNDGDGLVDCDDPGCDGTLVCVPVYSGESMLIINQDAIDGDQGAILDGDAWETAANNAGVSVLHVTDTVTTVLPILSEPALDVIVVCTGTFPSDDRPTATELEALAAAQAAGKSIVFTGGDHWGFLHVASSFDLVDGVAAGAADGNDAVVSLDGFDTGLGLADFSDLQDILYTQDQAGNDWTDQLQAATSAEDTGIVAAGKAFGPDDALAQPLYAVTVLAEGATGGNVISMSIEFGGIGDVATRDDVFNRMSAFLGATGGPGGPQFKRGDANNDNLFNVADVVFIAAALFVPGSDPVTCTDAGDVNDDGLFNVADAVFAAAALFVPGSDPVPAPGQTCGIDPTADAGGGDLGCAVYPNCP